MPKRGLSTVIVSIVLVCTLLVAAFTGCASTSSPSSPSSGADSSTQAAPPADTQTGDAPSTVTIWSWESGHKPLFEAFMADYPQFVLDVVPVEQVDMVQKVQTTLASGGQMPDLTLLDGRRRGKFLEMEIWEDISQEPYNFDTENLVDFLLAKETTPAGSYVGPEFPGLGAMCFKRELALEYFGTDDMEELEALLPDWETFIEKGKEVQEKSGGKVFMMSSLYSYKMIHKGQTTEPFFIDNKLNLRTALQPALETMIQMKNNGIIDIIEPNSPEEGASYAQDNHIFYLLPNWDINATVKPNDRDGEGRWGFMRPPNGFYTGDGACFAVPKTALNKVGAVEYIKYICSSVKGAELLRDISGSFSPYRPVYDEDGFYSNPEPWFDGVDCIRLYAERALPSIHETRLPTRYDADFEEAYNLVIKSITASDGSVTAEELIQKMEEELMSKNPDLVL